MLQITIMHEDQKTYVSAIKDMETFTVLAKFDNATNQIDLETLAEHVGETVLVSHLIPENNGIKVDYEHTQTIVKVEQDAHGLWYIEYN